MADLRTEEEQVEAIKSWWKENGRSTVLGILAAVAIVLGWRAWQQYEQTTAEQASALYQNLLSAATVQPGQKLDDEKRKTAEHLAGQLKTEFESLSYAQYAALWLAKNAVAQNDLAGARAELEWVLAQQPSETLASVTKMRLARVLVAQGEFEQALNQLQTPPAEGFQASFYEVKGDVLQAMGRLKEAREAYAKGMAAPQGAQRPILSMKLDDLAVDEAK